MKENMKRAMIIGMAGLMVLGGGIAAFAEDVDAELPNEPVRGVVRSDFDRKEMKELLETARLGGEVVIIEREDISFGEVLKKYSSNADLIMMGFPGKISEDKKSFILDEFFFDRQIANYDDLPATLFIKSVQRLELFER